MSSLNNKVPQATEGFCYFDLKDQKFYIDVDTGTASDDTRKCIRTDISDWAARALSDVNGKQIDTDYQLKLTAERGLSITNNSIGHSNQIITPGTVGQDQAPGNGGTFNIPKLTYDQYGHLTVITTAQVTLPDITNVPDGEIDIKFNGPTTSSVEKLDRIVVGDKTYESHITAQNVEY